MLYAADSTSTQIFFFEKPSLINSCCLNSKDELFYCDFENTRA